MAKKNTTTFTDVRMAAQSAYQRGQLLRQLVRFLDEHYREDDYDFLCSPDGGYERANRAVVSELRTELLAAWSRSHERYRRLCRARVANADALPVEGHERIL